MLIHIHGPLMFYILNYIVYALYTLYTVDLCVMC